MRLLPAGGNSTLTPFLIDTTAAEAYEKYMVPELLGPWAERAVELADPQPGEHVLDVACGTGIGARLAAKKMAGRGTVVGLDLDPPMLAVARATAASLEWHCASALKMPYGNATFDLCMCFQGLQFFPDRMAGFAEMRRVLKASGRLVATVWAPLERNKGQHAIIAALERQGIDTATARKAFSFSDPAALRESAVGAGFGDIEIRTEQRLSHFSSVRALVDAMASGSFVFRQLIAPLPETARDKLVEDATALLRVCIHDEPLGFPTSVHIVAARP